MHGTTQTRIYIDFFTKKYTPIPNESDFTFRPGGRLINLHQGKGTQDDEQISYCPVPTVTTDSLGFFSVFSWIFPAPKKLFFFLFIYFMFERPLKTLQQSLFNVLENAQDYVADICFEYPSTKIWAHKG